MNEAVSYQAELVRGVADSFNSFPTRVFTGEEVAGIICKVADWHVEEEIDGVELAKESAETLKAIADRFKFFSTMELRGEEVAEALYLVANGVEKEEKSEK